VDTINRKNGRILVVVSGISIVVNLITTIVTFAPVGLLGLILPILIIIFMLNPRSTAWFRAQGGASF
jgi:hypothetical protein